MSRGLIFSLLASFFWAVQIVVGKVALNYGENPYNLSFWQALLALPFWLWLCRRQWQKINQSDWWLIMGQTLIGGVGVAVFNSLAIKYSSTVNYSFLVRTTVIFTILFAYIFLKEKITARKILLSFLILAGAYLLTANGQKIALHRGDIYTLINAAFIALGNTVLGKMMTNRFGSYFAAALTFILSVPVLGIIAGLDHHLTWPQLPWLMISLAAIWSLSVIVRFRAYAYVSAAFIAMIYFLTPVFVSLLALIFLQEKITFIQIVGGAIIVLGGIFVNKAKI